jgi:group II intron reverse transcriptase/maturase
MQTKLNLISEVAGRDGECKINNLAYLLSEENLKDCFLLLSKRKAAGIDGVTLEEYETNLDSNLGNLVQRMKNQSYKPQPVRRTYIPKADGKLRPLGIPSIEDKIVQKGMARILESIYENDFLDFSYGFRPNRNCHQALKKLSDIIHKQPINHIIDADIKGFFDNVNHDWLMKFVEVRISDPNFLRLIKRFLKNGYMEEGRRHDTDTGTPQGGIVSPILANIYLHYALDLWVDRAVRPNCRGTVEIVRYADDFVICVQFKDEAERILAELKERLKKFNLELAEDKTRLIEFGKFAKRNAEKKNNKAATFNFLGFTHFIDRTKTGTFKIGRKTDRKKFKLRMVEMNIWLKEVRNLLTIKEVWRIFKAKLRGHFQYYGVSENTRSINMFYQKSLKLLFKWLNRRSQKKSFNWTTFMNYIERFELPRPKIHHNFYNLKAAFVNINEEPYVGNLQVRFCEGHGPSHNKIL